NNLQFTFIKIYGGLLTLILFFYFLINHMNFNIKYLFYWYCMFCYYISLIGIFQAISFFLNFKFGYDFSWLLNKWAVVSGGLIGIRVNSIISEPTYLATILSPCVYVSIKNLISKSKFIYTKFQSIIVISIMILTTSTIGYIGLLISVLLLTNTVRLRFIIFGILISIFGFSLAYNNVYDFKQRADAAKGLWIDNDFRLINTNNSSFVLYNNLHVAKENLLKYPLFGTGLGSHETAYKNYTLTKSLIQYDFEFNIKDGNSLFIRLCTETGLVGVFFVFAFIFKGFIYDNSVYDEILHINHVISQSIFVLLILVLIRQGNYMLNGLPLIFLLYHYNRKEYNKLISKYE
ncbi:hypothetical protein OA958_04410, partial [Bacteroidota bacterium]|nr:hypothetical protein [Bacteroidota bacterium]